MSAKYGSTTRSAWVCRSNISAMRMWNGLLVPRQGKSRSLLSNQLRTMRWNFVLAFLWAGTLLSIAVQCSIVFATSLPRSVSSPFTVSPWYG